MDVTCPACTTEDPPSAHFCRACGQTLAAPICATCGEALVPGARFCGTCGTPVGEAG